MLYFLKWNENFQHLFLLLKYQLCVIQNICIYKLTIEINSISFSNVRAKSLSKKIAFFSGTHSRG
jgi:hypothetical protein